MDVKRLICSIAHYLKLDDFFVSGRKKSIKELIKKLKERRADIFKSIRNAPYEDDAELQEELKIISSQIKKNEKILTRLNYKKAIKIRA